MGFSIANRIRLSGRTKASSDLPPPPPPPPPVYSLWGIASNNNRQINNLNNSNYTTFRDMSSTFNWLDVSGANSNVVAIREDGTTWGKGSNTFNQMGFTSTADVTDWTQIGANPIGNAITDAVQIVGGDYTTYVLRADGTAWILGRNEFQHAGYAGTILNQFVPIGAGVDNSDFTQIWASRENFVGRKSDGSIWGLGDNDGTQLGNATRLPVRNRLLKISPNNVWTRVKGGRGRIYALKTDGTIWGFGQQPNFVSSPTYVPAGVQLGFFNDFTDFAVNQGGDFVYGLRSDGTIWGMGFHNTAYKYFGTLANTTYTSWVRIGNTFSGVKSIHIFNGYAGIAVKTDGTIWGIGTNASGIMGSGSIKDTWTQIDPASGTWDSVFTTITNIYAKKEVIQ